MRKTEFKNGEFYHLYNRGVDKRDVFLDDYDYIRFITGMSEFNNESTYEQRTYERNQKLKELSSEASELSSFSWEGMDKLVEIICYCINPNHFHFILRQRKNNGIKIFDVTCDCGEAGWDVRRFTISVAGRNSF